MCWKCEQKQEQERRNFLNFARKVRENYDDVGIPIWVYILIFGGAGLLVLIGGVIMMRNKGTTEDISDLAAKSFMQAL